MKHVLRSSLTPSIKTTTLMGALFLLELLSDIQKQEASDTTLVSSNKHGFISFTSAIFKD